MGPPPVKPAPQKMTTRHTNRRAPRVRTVGLPAGTEAHAHRHHRDTRTQGHRDTGTDAADNYSETSGAAEASGRVVRDTRAARVCSPRSKRPTDLVLPENWSGRGHLWRKAGC